MAPWIGVRDALEEGSVCPQAVPDLNGTEDCLFLNIYTPQLPRNESSLLPVMAFLPGGGLYHGSATSQMYGPDYLVDAGVVLVTINYRLGPLGFLGIPHPEVTVNAGMKDQVAALRWIQWNIRQFGGDPKKVTLFGESAGGLSVEFHLLSHMSIGLFKQAISESGSVLDPFSYAKSTYEKAFKLAQILGFNTSDVNELVKFLKQVPADQLVLHQMKTLSKEESSRQLRPFVTTLEFEEQEGEEVFLPGEPSRLLDAGKFQKVPYITGINDAEGKGFVTDVLANESIWRDIEASFDRYVPLDLNLQMGSATSIAVGAKIREFYFGNQTLDSRALPSLIKLVTDVRFLLGLHHSLKKRVSNRERQLYVYQFAFDGKLGRSRYLGYNLTSKGASHSDELYYIFSEFEVEVEVSSDSPEMRTLRRMVTLWTNFAKTGDPNGGLDVTWKPITASDSYYLRIDTELSLKVNLEKERLAFWDQLYEEVHKGVYDKD